jgi:hypothetical protein
MSGNTVVDKLGYGPLQNRLLFKSDPIVGTTPVLFRPTWPAGQPQVPAGVKIKIVNGHATQTIAWSLVAFGASAPTITAAFVDATCASVILPGTEFFALEWLNGGAANPSANPAWDLYIVASGASTPVNVTFDIIF